jgi:hypothetical protein
MTTSECIDHGRRSSIGYARSGSAAAYGRQRLLHRQVFLDAHGYLPPVVMHTCDNLRCINLDHLRAGDWNLNNKDRAAKGRSAKVVLSRRKVTQEQADDIRSRWALRGVGKDPVNGVLALARTYAVDPNVVYNIVRGKTHVKS